MRNFLKVHPELWLLTFTAFVTRFLWIGYPREVVFDEVHFGKFLSAYLSGKTFFDIHPPLGKLLYVFIGWLVGFQPGFAFDHIGQPYTNVPIIALRMLPALLGALLVPLIYLVAKELGLSRPAATLAAAFVLFDNALLVQSRFMLLDIPLLFFGFASILFFLLGQKVFRRHGFGFSPGAAGGAATHDRGGEGGEPSSVGERVLGRSALSSADRLSPTSTSRSANHVSAPEPAHGKNQIHAWLLFALSAIFLGLTISIKWTALAFSVPLFILFMRILLKERAPLRFDAGMLALFILIPLALYLGFFAIHFWLIEPQKLQNFFQNATDLNSQMFDSNLQHLTHPYSSRWFEWPIMKRTVYYWNAAPGGITTAVIYLLGNPFVWMVSLLNLGIGFSLSMKALARRRYHTLFGYAFLSVTFLANLLPFISITRAMFLYHYFPALIFSFLIAGMNLDRLIPDIRIRSTMASLLIVTSVVFFLYFAPLSYGTRINDTALNERMWLPTWR